MQHQSQETKSRIFQVASWKCNLYTYYVQSNQKADVQHHILPLSCNYAYFIKINFVPLR